MAFGAQPVDFNYFLARKYALQQQEADATTSNAASQAIQARANAGVADTTARLNTVQANLAPAESASQNALRAAQARLTGVQADVLPGQSAADIALTRANASLTGTNEQVVRRQSLTPFSSIIGGGGFGRALGGVLGPQGFRFSPVADQRPARLPGETQAQYMDRTGWGL